MFLVSFASSFVVGELFAGACRHFVDRLNLSHIVNDERRAGMMMTMMIVINGNDDVCGRLECQVRLRPLDNT